MDEVSSVYACESRSNITEISKCFHRYYSSLGNTIPKMTYCGCFYRNAVSTPFLSDGVTSGQNAGRTNLIG